MKTNENPKIFKKQSKNKKKTDDFCFSELF